jgi:hypothetical protein
MVKTWWNDGETWSVDGHFSASKNTPLFPDLFLRDSRFGNGTGGRVETEVPAWFPVARPSTPIEGD